MKISDKTTCRMFSILCLFFFYTLTSFAQPLGNDSENLVVLRKKIDGTFIKSNRQYLKFTYKEKYARPRGNSNNPAKIECVIYDWEMNEQLRDTLDNSLGANMKLLNLPTTLIPDEYYLLEVTGANKGEVYYLRFKY